MTTEEIIANYFEGKLDAKDAAIVHAWLEKNPDTLKEYVGEEEWDDFEPPDVLSQDISGKLWNNIDKSTPSPKLHYSYFRWAAVAASLLLVVGLSGRFIFKAERGGITAAIAKPVFNNTSEKMALTLSDGSTVELSPSSTLSYPDNFNATKRDIILNGEANFTITKDAAKPFSVYSHSLLITVLGTRFTVKSYDADNTTKVILDEGRVMVKIADSVSRGDKNEYYLAPGDIFIFKNVKAAPSVRILHLEKDKDDCYVFDNYPLDVVFDQLQVIYNAKIIYNKADLGNRSFIGKIDKKDSLYQILKSVALLNNFNLHKEGDSLIIGK